MAFPQDEYQQWKNQTLGKGWDIDGSGDWDCVDMALSWALFLYGDFMGTIGDANAKDLWKQANPQYFQWIPNDVNNPNQLPEQGDLLFFDATPKAGYTNTFVNPYGHVEVCDSADGNSYTGVSQASGTSQAAHLDTKPWNFRPCLGWLRPLNVNGGSMDKITKEQEIALSQMATGSNPGKDYNYQFTGQPLTQDSLDKMLQFWAGFSKPATATDPSAAALKSALKDFLK